MLLWISVFGACGFPRPSDIVGDADSTGASDAAGVLDGAVDARTVDAFVAPPVITAFSPDWGSTSGGTLVRMLGFGFTGPHLTVRFGSSIASQVTVVSDTELTVMTPVGPHLSVDLLVTTDGGTTSATTKYRYLAPLYAADGQGAVAGNLYIIDPKTAASVSVGSLGVGVTGLALSPDGVLYGATTERTGRALITIDPYTARTARVGLFVNQLNVAVTVTDLAFESRRLLGWGTSSLIEIDPTTGRVSSFGAQTVGGGRGVASLASGTLLLAQGHNLSAVNTTNGSLIQGPALSNTASNSLTFVGTTLYGSEAVPGTPQQTRLVSIDPGTGVATVIGSLPLGIDAIEGIPVQSVTTGAIAPPKDLRQPPRISMAGRQPTRPVLRIAGRLHPVRDVLALGHDVIDGARVRRITPLSALADLGLGARVALVSTSGNMRFVELDAPGLALTMNSREELKLIDTREGFHRVLADITEIRDSSER
jgi:hypothetical protein